MKRINTEQQDRLKRKLADLCHNSTWGDAVKNSKVTNMSSRPLSSDENEALSYGLKYDCGKNKMTLIEHIARNYRSTDNSADRGFIQGVVTCCKLLSDQEGGTLPRRYHKALDELAKDESIIITSADKGGGIVIMDRSDYLEKMNDLLKDGNVYQKKKEGYSKQKGEQFNKQARKILKRSKKGKQLMYMIEQDPRSPRMRGLPKMHKPGVPMRPITSGIRSAPHQLAKILARPLSKALGSLSEAHIRNSGDILERLQELNFRNKKLASFDVKALFTNVPIDGAMEAIKKVLTGMPRESLPLPKKDFIAMVELCLKFDPFTFNGEEYAQREGLAMGSPLSPVAACLFLEMLEEDQFSKIMGPDTKWYRYVDDVLIVVPEELDLNKKLRELNEVHRNIQFTLEEEKDKTLNFLDITIIRGDDEAKFKVFRKPTNKEDYIHFYSAHSMRTKSGVVIGFFLRALRICSPDYLNEENDYIFKVFESLRYPKAFLIKCKNKAKHIVRKKKQNKDKNDEKKDCNDRIITVPHSEHLHIISKGLAQAGVKVMEKSGLKIGDIVKRREKRPMNENSIVYRVPCGGCKKFYVGETYRGLKTRISEHKRDLKNHKETNSIVIHATEEGHLPKWEAAETVQKGISRAQRKILESALIECVPCTNHKSGFYSLGTAVCQLAFKKYIKTFNT